MAHTTKVRPMKSSGSSETMAKQTSANNEGKLDNHDPRLIKLLTGICLGQIVIVTVPAVSLGVFVNENVSIKYEFLSNMLDVSLLFFYLEVLIRIVHVNACCFFQIHAHTIFV